MQTEDISETISRQWEERADALEQVKSKLRSGWRNDDLVLEQYFQGCYTNWKVYTGPRTTIQVLKLQSLYKQAIYGDSFQIAPTNLKSAEGQKWISWNKLRGMPKAMAKRRFITFLSEIDPLLIDVMPDEKPPEGFPLDREGRAICAKCNTMVGCDRELLDDKKLGLKKQLFENEELHTMSNLRQWVKHALTNQRCVWGMHTAVSKAQSRPFAAWFDSPSNKGFLAYDSTPVMLIVRDLLIHHFDLSYDLQQHKEEYGVLAVFNDQVTKTLKIKTIFEELNGEPFVYALPCTRDNDVCNTRRTSDNNRNHMHEVQLDPPSEATDNNSYEEAIALRMQCQKLGLKLSTGIVTDIKERCNVYRKRIEIYFESLKMSLEARDRNEKRTLVHKKEKSKIVTLSREMISRQCWEACNDNQIDKVMILIKRDCNPNEESPRGLTPLLCCLLNNPSVEIVEDLLLKFKANINFINKFGVSPLMLACRLRDTKWLHILMKNGASVLQKSGRRGQGMSALHWCAIHGSEEEAKIMMDYIKESAAGDSLRFIRFLDSQNDNGDTAMILAARSRNGLLCKTLSLLGANSSVLNNVGKNAYFTARGAGWTEIAEWLERKVGSGVAKLETYGDVQFEQSLRFGLMKVRQAVQKFAKVYVEFTHENIITLSSHFLGSPSKLRVDVLTRGERALKQQKSFVDLHQLYILKKDEYNCEYELTAQQAIVIETMKECVKDMLVEMRKGVVNPNCESDAKPFSFTPLMCAVLLNDTRSVKLMIREGADPNYANRFGMTALMLGSQVGSLESVVEMLIMGGDITAVDNEGYTAYAYCNSLPVPSNVDRSSIGVITEGDVDGPKRMTSYELLKLSETYKSDALKDSLQQSINESTPDLVENHYRFLRLLEKYGLSRLETNHQLYDQTRTSQWRIDSSANQKLAVLQIEDNGETSIEKHEREMYEAIMEKKRQEQDDMNLNGKSKVDDDMVRCPICTLWVPCSHFMRASTVKKFYNKTSNTNGVVVANSDSESLQSSNSSLVAFKGRSLTIKDKRQDILNEAHIGDRKTDRSLTLVNVYRPRDLQIQKEKRKTLLLEFSKPEEEEEEKVFLNEGKTLKTNEIKTDKMLIKVASFESDNNLWLKCFDTKTNSLYFKHKLNGLTWFQYVDNHGTPYFYNTDSGESVWQSPNESIAALLLINDRSESNDKNKDIHAHSHIAVSSQNGKGASPSSGDSIDADYVSVSDSKSVESIISIKSVLKKSTIDLNFSSNSIKMKKHVSFSDEKSDHGASFKSQPQQFQTTRLKTLVDGEKLVAQQNTDKSSELVIANANTAKEEEKKGGEVSSNNLIDALREGSVSRIDSIGPNPVPGGKSRRLYLFTSDSMDRSGQTEGVVNISSMKTGNSAILSESKLKQSKSISPISKQKKYDKNAPIISPPGVQLSGWLFVSLSSLDAGSAPVDSMKIPLEVWGALLEHIRNKFIDEWAPQSKMYPLLDLGDKLTSMPTRCSVCFIGFIRQKNIVDNINSNKELLLCMSCQVRQEIYEKAKLVLPRTLRRKAKAWPFRRRREVVGGNERDEGSDIFQSQRETMLLMDESLDHDKAEVLRKHLEFVNKSPIASYKLFELDEEAMDIHMPISNDCNNNDNNVLDLENMSTSDVSKLSVDSSDSQTMNSSLSTTDEDLSKYCPREITMIPFLIAKGHYEEVERLVRLLIGNRDVNEGEGLSLLVKVLILQAGMYELMGLWPLAVGVLMDCVELTSRLLGFEDVFTLSCINKTTLALRKMNCGEIAKEFIKSLNLKMSNSNKSEIKSALGKAIHDKDRHQDIMIKTMDDVIDQGINETAPNRVILQRIFAVNGAKGLFQLIKSANGFDIAARIAFFFYCENYDNNTLIMKQCAQFLNYILKIRNCDNEEVSRHLCQQMFQRLLSKSIASKASNQFNIATKFWQSISVANKKCVSDFLSFGISVKLEIFDDLVIYAITELSPAFKQFYYGQYGNFLRDHRVENAADVYFISASLIQSLWRGKCARKKTIEKLKFK